MKYWRLIIAVIILIALVVYARFPAKKSTAAANPAVAHFDPGQATRIQIDQPGQPEVVVDKDGGVWKLAQPYAAPADSGAMSTLLATASNIVPDESLGAESNLANFGLQSGDIPGGAASTQITLKNGQTYSLQFGTETPTSGDTYFKLASAANIYTVPGYVKSDVIKSAFDLRDKSLIHFSADKLTSLALDYKGKRLLFERKDGKWPVASQDNINTLTDALSNAQMDAMTDPTGKNAAKYGLTHPATRVTLAWSGGQTTLEVGAANGTSEHYARSSESPAVVTMNNYLLTDVNTLANPPKPPALATAAKAPQKTPKS